MSNELSKLIDVIQFKKKLTLEEIADAIGYSRPYLNNAKLSGGKSKKLIGVLKAKYPEVLIDSKIAIDYDKESMAKDLIQLKAIVKMLRSRHAKLEAKVLGRSLEEVLEELDNDTTINIKDLVGIK